MEECEPHLVNDKSIALMIVPKGGSARPPRSVSGIVIVDSKSIPVILKYLRKIVMSLRIYPGAYARKPREILADIDSRGGEKV